MTSADEVAEAFDRCTSEATLAFGNGELYVEEYITNSRHIEVQILCDQHGGVADLGERECSVQRRFQKIVEVAPAPNLAPEMRKEIIAASHRLAESVGYSNIGTMEFLVQGDRYVFIEANARLQVEHTVTEEVTGVDICGSQIQLAGGVTLAALGLDEPGVNVPRGRAIQARVNMEQLQPDGTVRPSGGVITACKRINPRSSISRCLNEAAQMTRPAAPASASTGWGTQDTRPRPPSTASSRRSSCTPHPPTCECSDGRLGL